MEKEHGEKDFKLAIRNALAPIAKKEATERGLQLLRIDVRGTQHTPVIEVILDGSRAISVEDCEVVSRSLNKAIEEGTLVKGNFRLDVMSPGLEEPLKEDWQLKKNIGRLIEAHYEDAGETHTVHGYLREFTEKFVGIEPIDHAKKSHKPRAVVVDTLVGIEPDEQLYGDAVELVMVDRMKIVKLVVIPVF